MFAEKGDVDVLMDGKVKWRVKERKVGRALGEMVVFLAFGYAGKGEVGRAVCFEVFYEE